MIVYAYMADAWGCGWHRIGYVAGVLQEQGHDVRVVLPGAETNIGGVVRQGHLIDATCPPDADAIILQRPCNQKLAEAVPLLRAKGVTVIVDIDDDLSHIHPRNPAWSGLHPKANPAVNWAHAAQACRDASLVTVSTTALAEVYGSHGRVRVLENCVPRAMIDMPHVDADWVGWPGSLASHPDDLGDVGAAMQRLDADFRVIGSGEGVARVLGLSEIKATGDVAFEDWSAAVSQIGVGVTPLADTRFNRAKSWLKPLTLAALGVPFVASSVGEYERFCALGAGQAVQRRGWYGALRALVTSQTAREAQSGSGRLVATDYTYEGRAWLWAEAWAEAIKRERE